MIVQVWRGVALVAMSIAATGCSSEATHINAADRLPLKHLAILYGQYRSSHQGQVPKDEASFKDYIKKLDPNQLNAAGVDQSEIEKLFVSPRDNEPYVIRYNNPPPAPGPNGPSAVGYEKTGKNGKRFVAFTTGELEEVDEARFAGLKFAGK